MQDTQYGAHRPDNGEGHYSELKNNLLPLIVLSSYTRIKRISSICYWILPEEKQTYFLKVCIYTEDRGGCELTEKSDTLQQPPPLPHSWVFVLSALVVLAALAAVLFWLFTAPAINQYPIILALVCFALSTVSCLLFAAQTKIQSTLPIAAITIGGPAVTWVAALWIVSYLFPAQTLTPQNFVDVLRGQLLRQGWKTFPDWVNQLGQLRWVILRDEANNIRAAMDTAYYLGSDRKKLTNPTLQVVFVYSTDNTAVKLERVRGNKEDVADIFFKGSTTQMGTARSLLLAKSGDTILVSDLGGDSDWTQIRTEILGCLIITFYPNEGMFPEGDILYVETNKYRKAGLANIDTGILASQPIKTPNAWLVAGYPFPLPDEVPVIFKNVSASWENSTDTIFQSLAEWLAFIDEPASHGRVSESARQFLQTVKATLPENNFSKFQGAEIYKTRLSTHLNQISDTVAITFETK